jgi:hypothetical protein
MQLKLYVYMAAAMLAGCSGGESQSAFMPSAPIQQNVTLQRSSVRPAIGSERRRANANAAMQYVYVSNRTRQGSSQLLVYPGGVHNPAPIRTITQGLVNVAGVAVDQSGNVYVALRSFKPTRKDSTTPLTWPSRMVRSTLRTRDKLWNTLRGTARRC